MSKEDYVDNWLKYSSTYEDSRIPQQDNFLTVISMTEQKTMENETKNETKKYKVKSVLCYMKLSGLKDFNNLL